VFKEYNILLCLIVVCLCEFQRDVANFKRWEVADEHVEGSAQ
jgi:hypothetical protein